MAEGGLAKALLATQKATPAVQKDSINPHFKSKFVSLNALMEAVLPVLNENGLVLLQHPTTLDGEPALTTEIVHATSGEKTQSTMLLAAAKMDPQGQGSAITYARRYALMSILGLVADEDDDGAGAQRATQQPRRTPQRSEKPVTATVADKPTPVTTETMETIVALLDGMQLMFGNHESGKTWNEQMTEKAREWFGKPVGEISEPEAQTLIRRLEATKAKLAEGTGI